jgi:hypothetical protein
MGLLLTNLAGGGVGQTDIDIRQLARTDGHPLCNACGLFVKLHGVVRPFFSQETCYQKGKPRLRCQFSSVIDQKEPELGRPK